VRPVRRLAATLAALVLASALAGCSIVESTVQQGVDDAIQDAGDSIEGAFEGATGVDVEAGDEVPADFPASVPLIPGTVVHAGSATVQGEGNWVVGVQVDAPVADAFAQARTLLVDAGFTSAFATETGERSVATFTSAELNVLIT